MRNPVLSILIVLSTVTVASAQQRPLVTEDPETIGLGLVLLEGGFDFQRSVFYPVSGLEGNLLRLPTLGVSFGISSTAELQLDGGLYNRLSVNTRQPAPLSNLLDFTGDHTSDVEDLTIATKIRVAAEKPGRPAVGLRFATRLPNASNESGLGLDTTDFYASLLIGKTVQSVRLVGNAGLGILGQPTNGNSQNDVFTYGVSFARAVQEGVEIVGELNGRIDTREGDPPPGTESRGAFRLGGRVTRGSVRLDGAIILGLTSPDTSFGFTAGLTWVFRAK
jgi:Putative MetA-pathway of phenol degradation